jgi:adenylosuccinate synthase
MRKAIIVIDLGFGDSGKGNCVQYLTSLNKFGELPRAIIRFNGGHQAAHGVRNGDTKHIFSSFGSGSLLGIPTYWGKECTINPVAFINEWTDLVNKGIEPIFYANPDCPITTPFDIMGNQMDGKMKSNGTVGVGFGTTIKRQEDYFKLHLRDLFFPIVLENKLKAIIGYYRMTLTGENIKIIKEFMDICRDFVDKVEQMTNSEFSKEIIGEDGLVIFEGAQGVLLDMDYGFFPHVTRSNTTSKGALQLCQEMGISDIELYHVTRTYHTRHGNGPFVRESVQIKNEETENNTWGEFQGDFRRGKLDMNLLEYSFQSERYVSETISEDNINLFITCCDQLEPSQELLEFSEKYRGVTLSYSDDSRESYKEFNKRIKTF